MLNILNICCTNKEVQYSVDVLATENVCLVARKWK